MAESPVLKSVKAKVGKLIADNSRLRDENAKAVAQRDKLKDENRHLAGQIAELEKRINILELKDGFSGGGANAKVARARVNRLMREVDKCIALLNR